MPDFTSSPGSEIAYKKPFKMTGQHERDSAVEDPCKVQYKDLSFSRLNLETIDISREREITGTQNEEYADTESDTERISSACVGIENIDDRYYLLNAKMSQINNSQHDQADELSVERIPASPGRSTYRTVCITSFSNNLSIHNLLSQIPSGLITDISPHPLRSINSIQTVMISFLDESSAAHCLSALRRSNDSVKDLQCHSPLRFDPKIELMLAVSLDKDLHPLIKNGTLTRVLEVRGMDFDIDHSNWSKMLSNSGTTRDDLIAIEDLSMAHDLTIDMAGSPDNSANKRLDNKAGSDGDDIQTNNSEEKLLTAAVRLHFNSVKNAIRVYKTITSKKCFAGFRVVFGKDPCDCLQVIDSNINNTSHSRVDSFTDITTPKNKFEFSLDQAEEKYDNAYNKNDLKMWRVNNGASDLKTVPYWISHNLNHDDLSTYSSKYTNHSRHSSDRNANTHQRKETRRKWTSNSALSRGYNYRNDRSSGGCGGGGKWNDGLDELPVYLDYSDSTSVVEIATVEDKTGYYFEENDSGSEAEDDDDEKEDGHKHKTDKGKGLFDSGVLIPGLECPTTNIEKSKAVEGDVTYGAEVLGDYTSDYHQKVNIMKEECGEIQNLMDREAIIDIDSFDQQDDTLFSLISIYIQSI